MIIAQGVSTIRFATRIIVLDAGRILDTGPHDDLFDRCPLYRILQARRDQQRNPRKPSP